MSMSSNSSNSNSTSTTAPVETPENQIIDQISGVASGLANQMYSWAQGVFQQTSQITNQAVGNFFNVSQQMLGLSNTLTGQYNNLFAPENAQLVADANSYASPQRMAVDMGQAGATQAQAGDQALKNSEQQLQSYGIDPSSGRYAALDKAAAVQNAANVAGAENTQRNADIATGQKLRSEAVQVGATLPAAIANVNNTAIQANTGATNATLANANTGANLMSLPDKYLQTAMGVKLPFSGSQGQSQSHSSGSSSSPDKSGGGGGGGNGGGGNQGGGGGGGPAWMPQHGGGGVEGTGYAARGGAQPGSHIMNVPPYGQPDAAAYNADPFAGFDTGMGSVGEQTTDPFASYGSGTDQGAGAFGNSYGQDWGNGNTADPNVFGGQDTQSYTGDQFSGGSGFGNGSDQSGLGAFNYDPYANSFNPSSNSTTGTSYDTSNWQDPTPQMSSDPGIWGSGSDQSYSDPFAGGSGTDMSSYGDTGFAAGGPVPAAMSPSGGQRVDDVQAQGPRGQHMNLNAHEFVIPQDVALWKGQEFFQNLIDQSRKKRVMAPAKPQPAAPTRQPNTMR
jgi:uncharacterized membrane protein YgcG